MRRVIASLLVLGSLVCAMPAAVAATQLEGCTNSLSEITVYRDWRPGDGVPAPGEDAWWNLTVAGIEAEGLTVAEVAAAFGQPSVDAFHELVVTGIVSTDENGNGTICYKPFPGQQNGWEAYWFHTTDDKVR